MKLLVVDDEIPILKALNRVFIDTDVDIVTAESGEEALEKLEQEEINIIISDMKMPHMDGYELLSKVKKLYPKIIRVMLSGYADEKVVFHALQKNIARFYIFKPWKNDEIMQIVTYLIKVESDLNNSNMLSYINTIENLPTSKKNYDHILHLLSNETDIGEISNEVEKDISISAKILNVANSAFYNSKTGSVKQATSYIGLQNVKELVLSTPVIETQNGQDEIEEMIRNIWNHSLLSNQLLTILYEKYLKKKVPDLYSSAALFHNIGKIFFLKYYLEEYIKLLARSKTEGIGISNLEKRAFAVSHNEVGAFLLEWWEIPFPIVEASLYHHNPLDDQVINKELVCSVHIAIKYASDLLGCDWSEEFDVSAFHFLNISKNDFEEEIVTLKL